MHAHNCRIIHEWHYLKYKRFEIPINHLQKLSCVEVKLSVFVEARNPRILSPQSSTFKLIFKNQNLSFLVKLSKTLRLKFSCLSDKR